MSSIDDFTDEELGQIVREATMGRRAEGRASLKNRNAFFSFLNIVGLGWVVESFKLVTWGWEKLRGLFHKIFTPSLPWGSFQEISFLSGQTGITLRCNFTVYQLENVECYALAIFTWADNNPLKSIYQDYKTASNDLCTWENFTPRYSSSEFTNFDLYLPNDALLINKRGVYDLKYKIYLRQWSADKILMSA